VIHPGRPRGFLGRMTLLEVGSRNYVWRRFPTRTFAVLSQCLMKTASRSYRQMVESYFQLEYSDTPLQQVLGKLPSKYRVKAKKVMKLHHQLKKPPSDAAAYVMRILRGRCKSLIAGLEEN
jgi:hypothetical protein